MKRGNILLGHILISLAGLGVVCSCQMTNALSNKQSESIDLSGKWGFKLDPQNVGEKQKWYAQKLPDTIRLPGSTAESGYGDDITMDTEWTGNAKKQTWSRYEKYIQPDNFHVPVWLQPAKHYVGSAWYQKHLTIPDTWQDKRIVLFLERCHWETRVWIDGKPLGEKNSLSTPNKFELASLDPGPHVLTIRVDNTVKINVGNDAHSVSDNTQTNWNGIVGDIRLRATDTIWIDDLQVYPDVKRKIIKIKVQINNNSKVSVKGRLVLQAESFNSKKKHQVVTKNIPISISQSEKSIDVDCPMGDGVLLWDEFSPNLYRLTALIEGENFSDTKTAEFGMREFATDGTQFVINGRKTFLRGTLECCIFPKTGYPPTDIEEWTRIIKVAKAHGLNHFRFHSWCPPQAAFEAANRLGFYFQVEGPFWTVVGNGGPVDEYIYAECNRILKEFGNHPSFCLMAYGNEPGGGNQKKFLGDLVNYWKKKDPRHLYTSAAGWPVIPENQFHSMYGPRIHHWGHGLNSRINALPPETTTDYRSTVAQHNVPIVSHEIGQWCVYPNFHEIKKYTGVLKTRNFEIFQGTLKENHMLDQAQDFLMASGKLQTLCYKEEIESALRTPGFGGFQLLDLHDFPGQGTALVGVLDPFWEEKGYVSPEQFSRFCNQTVPLARMKKRTWTSDETFKADIEISHFGPYSLTDQKFNWNISTEEGKTVEQGSFRLENVPVDNGTKVGTVELALYNMTTAQKLNLTVSLEGADFANDWDFWVYPEKVETTVPDDIHFTSVFDKEALSVLKQGGKVLLIPAQGTVKGDKNGKIPPGFSSIFWNTAWTGGQPPHTLGILCDPQHPALAEFPTEYHSNWQWWDLITKSQTMILNDFPPKLRPIVQVIDDWFTNRRLGLVFEANVQGGKLLVCGIDLQNNLDRRPVARQLRYSLLRYMQSNSFNPQHNLKPSLIRSLFTEPSLLQSLGARVIGFDSQAQGHEGPLALDSNPSTFWHTQWQPNSPAYPHEIRIDLKQQVKIKGFRFLPRQDGNPNGWIKDYALYLSNDKDNWGESVIKGSFAAGSELKTVPLDNTQTGRYVKFVALSAINPDHPWASLAEIDIISTE